MEEEEEEEVSQSGHAIVGCDVQIGISAAADAIFSGFAQWEEGRGKDTYGQSDNGRRLRLNI